MSDEHPGVSTPNASVQSERSRRLKDIWQLHIPLIVVVGFCIVATVIEFRRAQEGVDRAWVYTFQWPIIGAFAFIVWNRYRKHGSITKSISRYFRERAARFEAEADAAEEAQTAAAPVDPDEIAWRDHVRELRRNDPAGGPPDS
jgi:hypothetical protein